MRGLLRSLVWGLVALGFFSVGADAYWSWKAHAWAFRPISFYLDLIHAGWANDLVAAAAAHIAPGAGRVAARFIAFPVWGPCFVIGFGLAFLTQPRGDVRPR